MNACGGGGGEVVGPSVSAFWRPCAPEDWRAQRDLCASAADASAAGRASEILAALRSGGSDALLRLEGALRRDPALPVRCALLSPALPAADVEVPADVLRSAPERVPAALVVALRTAAARLLDFLAPGLPRAYAHLDAAGNRAEMAVVPLERAGIYVPGGRAPYMSSVLMGAIPARVAGVGEVVLCTPATADGGADAGILAAAAVAGVDRVFLLSAVQAVAAMAYGLDPVPACDKVVGPGNAYVVAAKRLIFGDVGVDGLPGPSEIVVVASEGADPVWVAADLLAQAEHGPDALSLLVTPDADLAAAVGREAAAQVARLPARRRLDTLDALAHSGGPVLVPDLASALSFAERLCPEHLSLQGAAAEALAPHVRRAGAVFVGAWSPVAAGDYAAGTDHVLPTSGAARFASALSAADFVRRVQVFTGVPGGVGLWAGPAQVLAEAEGFAAHSASLALRRLAAPPAETAPAVAAPYVPPVPAGAVRLDLNENPFPWSEQLWTDVLRRLRGAEPTRYPRDTDSLQAALARYAGVPADWCLPGNGSDELLLAVAAAWGRRVARAVLPTPTFGMYRRLSAACGVPVCPVSLGPPPDFALPVEAMLRQCRAGGETLLFLCRPNNPTGGLWSAEDIRPLVEAQGVWTVVDEAYSEFSGEALTEWLERYPRLCLLRTMSKAFALAGLRVGYALGRPDALRELRQAVQPWAISAFSCAAALAALEDRPRMEGAVASLICERRRLQGELANIPGIRPYPSHANYILFGVDAPVAGWDAFDLFDRLYARGVVLRRWSDEPALRHCLRVSVGRPEENDRFLSLLRTLIADAART